MRPPAGLILALAVVALACGVAAAVIALRVLQTVVGA